MVPLILGRLSTILYGLPGTPLEAGKALLTSMLPDRPFFRTGHLDIVGGTHFNARCALVAFLVDPEIFVPAGNPAETQLIDR